MRPFPVPLYFSVMVTREREWVDMYMSHCCPVRLNPSPDLGSASINIGTSGALRSTPCLHSHPHHLTLIFPMTTSRSALHGRNRKLVLAFDVGTTYSGISYRYAKLRTEDNKRYSLVNV